MKSRWQSTPAAALYITRMISKRKKVIQQLQAGHMLKPRMDAVGFVPHAFQPHTLLTSLSCFTEQVMDNTTAISTASRLFQNTNPNPSPSHNPNPNPKRLAPDRNSGILSSAGAVPECLRSEDQTDHRDLRPATHGPAPFAGARQQRRFRYRPPSTLF